MIEKNICPCGSQKKYQNCCGRYIDGHKHAPIAESLMRSRYTAYALGNIDYIKQSWAPETADKIDFNALKHSLKFTQYLELKIISKVAGTRKNTQGQVAFIATFDAGEGVEYLNEISNFIKIDGKWLYLDGKVSIT